MTRIPSGVTDQGFYFVAVDATDFTTRETGLSTWTVYRERNNGTSAAMTTPTITEVDATNLPGVYFLLCDEDMTIGSGNDTEEMVFHITHSGMAPVSKVIELYRPKITAGETLTVSSGAVGTVNALAATALDGISSTATGMVEVAKAVWDRVLSAATHNVANSAGRRIRQLQDNGLYADAAVWIDTVNGTAGTTDYENGTVTNPVDSLADALTIAGSIGLKRFRIVPGSTITLSGTVSGYQFSGFGWSLALNSINITSCYFEGAVVSGIGTATIVDDLDYPLFFNCTIGTATIPPSLVQQSRLTSTLTFGSAGTYALEFCTSRVAGGGAPVVDMGSGIGATQLNVRHYSGGVDLRNCLTSDEVTLEYVAGQVILASSCTGGTVVLRGIGSLTDNSAGTTVTKDAFLNLSSINAEVDTAISDAALATAANLATVDTVVDAIKAVTDNLPDSGALTTLLSNVAAILTDTGTTIPGTLATIDGKVDTVDTVADAVKAKTDSLTFTVANQVDANIQYVNDTAVTGDGGSGTEWGP